MSYDIYLNYEECELCGRACSVEVKYDSPTYNYGAMIRKADKLAGGEGCSFAAIHEKEGTQAEMWFDMILEMMQKHPEQIQPLEPDNGWGTFGELQKIFTDYLRLSCQHPGAIWTQSGDGTKERRCCAGWVCGRKE